MDKKEYEMIEDTANHFQSSAEERCSKEIGKAQSYRDGYVKGIEDLLSCIRRNNT